MPDIEIKQPDEYEEFTPMNPGNSAPAVVFLASDDSKPLTGQVLRMVGNSLCVYKPWEMGEEFYATDKEGNPTQWDPADIGRILNRYHFQTMNPGIDAPAHGRLTPSPMTKRVAIVGAALSDCGRVDTKSPFELHYQARQPRARRRRAHQGRRRRLRLERHGPARAGRDRRVPRPAPDVGRRHRRRRRDVGVHGRARGRPRSRPATPR